MKKLLLVAACIVATVGALAQGQVNFNNKVGTSVVAPVYDTDGTTTLAGTAFSAQLYAGTSADSLSAVGSVLSFRTGAAAGFVSGGGAVTVPFTTAGFFQMRAWESAGGASYEAAVAAGKHFGKSETFSVTPTVAPATPADLVGLKSFSLVPEPTTMALGLLGAAALAFIRRK